MDTSKIAEHDEHEELISCSVGLTTGTYFLKVRCNYIVSFLYIFLVKNNIPNKRVWVMDVNLLKEDLEVYCSKNGIKYKYIANEIHTSESMLCHWRKGRKNLQQNQLEQLKNLLGATI